jgi:hypothetical protein
MAVLAVSHEGLVQGGIDGAQADTGVVEPQDVPHFVGERALKVHARLVTSQFDIRPLEVLRVNLDVGLDDLAGADLTEDRGD